jgi:transposase
MNRLKVLWWDANGYCLLYKRVHRAVFVLPGSPGERCVRIDGGELAKIIAGVARERRRRSHMHT